MISLGEKYATDNIKIQFTGGLIIDYEEVNSVSSGALLSGMMSLILVGIILFATLKKIKLIISLILSILIGLLITTGIISLTIGSLNLISVAFAVLFIGLSVDFGIQVFLRLLEKKNTEVENYKKEIGSVSKTIAIASIPSIVGFLSFVPTKYTGLSELGIISAIGLLVGLLVNIIFLPSIYSLIKKPEKESITKKIDKRWEIFFNFIILNKYYFIICLILIFIYDIFSIKFINFDSDAMKVKDQKLQSVKLAKELIEKNPTSDYIISIIEKEKDKFR